MEAEMLPANTKREIAAAGILQFTVTTPLEV